MTDAKHSTTAAATLPTLLALRGGSATARPPTTCGTDDSMSDFFSLRESWQRADAQSGGLLGWAMQEMGIAAAEDASDASHGDDNDDTASETTHSARLGSSLTPLHGAPGSSRRRLTGDEAVAIYLAKLGPMPSRAAGRLAREFGITVKAVRDVWTGRTWQAATTRVHAQQQHNNFLPLGVVSRGAVAAAARVTRAL